MDHFMMSRVAAPVSEAELTLASAPVVLIVLGILMAACLLPGVVIGASHALKKAWHRHLETRLPTGPLPGPVGA